MCVLVCVNCCQWQSPGPVLCLTHPPAHLLQLRWQHRHLEHGRDSARGERVISDIAVDSVHQIVLKRISSAAATEERGSGFFVFLFCSTGLHTVSWDLVLSLFNQTHSFTSVFCPNSLCSETASSPAEKQSRLEYKVFSLPLLDQCFAKVKPKSNVFCWFTLFMRVTWHIWLSAALMFEWYTRIWSRGKAGNLQREDLQQRKNGLSGLVSQQQSHKMFEAQ